jgi:hypothetical protein
MISKTISCLVRGVQALVSLVIMALVGHMISTSGWNMLPREGGNAAEVNYAMFLAVWTLLAMTIFIPVALGLVRLEERLRSGPAFLDGLTTLFYFSGGVALASAMGIHSCTFDSVCSLPGLTHHAFFLLQTINRMTHKCLTFRLKYDP